MKNPANNTVDLLSIDAEAHLQKLASCMFPTPAQLPVELVRDSLKRGAKAIRVEVRRGRLVIEDEGAGIAEDLWRELACAFDPNRSAMAREKGIDALQNAASPGIGLLAVYIPGATGIRIENSASHGASTLIIPGGEVRRTGTAARPYGTRITITRRRGPAEFEKKLLRELCAAVPGDITLNGRRIESKPLLRRSMVQQNVDMGTGRNPAAVSVPAAGDICRVWLLDQWIPWQVFTCPHCHGLVFEAAMETGSAPTPAELDRLTQATGRMYQWLAENHHSFPQKYQERIEELLFKKAGWSGDMHLLSAFAPFRLWRSRRRLTLDEIRRKVEKTILYALPIGSNPEHLLGRHQEALLLTPLQKDFLLNRLGLPLVEPPAPMGTQGKLAELVCLALRKIGWGSARLPRLPQRPLAPEQMSGEEKLLCREMENCWLHLHHHGHSTPVQFPLKVVMVEGRGLTPAVWRNRQHESVLQLRRRHPLVVLAVQRVARDHADAEMAFAALAPMPLLTAVTQ